MSLSSQKNVMTGFTLLSCLSLLLFSGSSSYGQVQEEAPSLRSSPVVAEPPALQAQVNYARRFYVLGPNDTLDIQFLGTPEFNQTNLRVSADGSIMLPAVGIIDVTGKSLEQLQTILTERYSRYLKNPEIAVNINQTKPFIVYVTGAVMRPGSYELNTNPSRSSQLNTNQESYVERKTPLLSNVLLAAGGISYDADLEHVVIENSFTKDRFDVNLLDLLAGNANQDVYLIPGDSVQIPRHNTAYAVDPEKYRKFAAATFSPNTVPVRVFGYVRQPGVVNLEPTQSLTLNSAIMGAGGYYEDYAYAPNKVYLSRMDGHGRMVTREVNPRKEDITVLPNDLIYVPEKFLPKVARTVDYIARLADGPSGFANTYNGWALVFNPTRNFRP